LAELLYAIAGIIALAAIVLSFIRLLLGPSVSDRAVALDGMTIISLSGIALLAYFLERVIYLDVALVYGILSFMAVIALARYLEKEL
jgi:multicomponent Na+:H+ antiporter subunit F